ncbi:MAG: hypothetical protein ACKESB_01095 [Candidatus Hodgkinia cicadicola]
MSLFGIKVLRLTSIGNNTDINVITDAGVDLLLPQLVVIASYRNEIKRSFSLSVSLMEADCGRRGKGRGKEREGGKKGEREAATSKSADWAV